MRSLMKELYSLIGYANWKLVLRFELEFWYENTSVNEKCINV